MALTACGAGQTEDGYAPKVDVDETVVVPVPNTDDIVVFQFTMPDGRTCIASDGYNSGGIWCEPTS